MTYKDMLRAAVRSPTAQWNTFLTEYRPSGDDFYFFVEGQDDYGFYSHFFRLCLGDSLEKRRISPVSCGPRKEVLLARDRFLLRFPQSDRVLFFIDRDHEDLVPGGDPRESDASLCVTDTYSIENYLCTEEVVRRSCMDLLGIFDAGLLSVIQRQFAVGLARFQGIAKRWMAIIIALRRKGFHSRFSNLKTNILCSRLDENLLPVAANATEDIDHILSCFTNAQSPTDEELDSIMAELDNIAPKKWLRGKQELWYLVQFMTATGQQLVALKEELQSQAKTQTTQDHNSDEPKLPSFRLKLPLGMANAIAVLTSRASVPTTLSAFFNGIGIRTGLKPSH